MRIVALAALVLAGCGSSGTKVTDDQAAQFQKGKATEAEVIARFGKPDMMQHNPDGTKTDVYVYTHAAANAASYVPIVGLFAGGATGTNQQAHFKFDTAGVLMETMTLSSDVDYRSGLLNQK
jgi:hypothetical protein